MDISWNSISAGAMTASMTLNSALQSWGAGAANMVQAGAATSSQLASGMALVEKPVRAAANGMGSQRLLLRSAKLLGKALPIVTIGASALQGASIVDQHGSEALLHTKKGRGAVLGAGGGALLLMPFPPTQIAAAAVLGAAAANEFGAFERFDKKY